MAEERNYKKLVLLAGFSSVGTALLLIVMKFAVWMVSGSSSILASLMDSTIDLGASFINLLALRFAMSPPDKEHRFGHYKAEALASLCQAAFIGGSAFFLVMHGFERLLSPRELYHLDWAIAVSAASIVITLILVSFQSFVCRLTHSEAIGADRYHYLSDLLLNAGVIASLICSQFGYLWADGLFAIMLGLFIFRGSWHIGHTAVSTLLDRSMTQLEHERVLEAVLAVPGVDSIHDLRTRRAGPCYFIQGHLVMDPQLSLHQAHHIATQAELAVRALFPEADITLHMEPDESDTYRDVKFIDNTVCAVDFAAMQQRTQQGDRPKDQPTATAAATTTQQKLDTKQEEDKQDGQ